MFTLTGSASAKDDSALLASLSPFISASISSEDDASQNIFISVLFTQYFYNYRNEHKVLGIYGLLLFRNFALMGFTCRLYFVLSYF